MVHKGRQYLLLADEDLMSLTGAVAGYVRGEVVELGNGRAVLMTEGLPAPSEGEAYEAWLLRDGVPDPAGLFESHHGTAAMPIEGSIEDSDAVAVTVEPSGGSPQCQRANPS